VGASGRQDGDYGELKKKFELFQARAKDIVIVLKSEIGGSGNQAVVQAIQDLEGIAETTNEPKHMEEVQLPDEEHLETEPEAEGQGQTEAEAMQEALF
jgi:hypothetical protein